MDTEFELIVNTKSRPTTALYWRDFQKMIQLAENKKINQFVISNEDIASNYFSAQNFKKLSKNQEELVIFEINPEYGFDILSLFEDTGFLGIYAIYIKLTHSNYTADDQEKIEKMFSDVFNFKKQRRVDKIGVMINSENYNLVPTLDILDFLIFEDTELFSDEAMNFINYSKNIIKSNNQNIISNEEFDSKEENKDISDFFNFSFAKDHDGEVGVTTIKTEQRFYYKSKQIDKILDFFNLLNNDSYLKFNSTEYYKVDVLKRVIEAKYSFKSLKDKVFDFGYNGIMVYAEDCYSVNLITKNKTLSGENFGEVLSEFLDKLSWYMDDYGREV